MKSTIATIDGPELAIQTGVFAAPRGAAVIDRTPWIRAFRQHRALWRRRIWASRMWWARFLGRGAELLVVGAIGVLALPVLVLAAILVKLTDGGPILYWQTRIGLRGREFLFPKIRSMVANAHEIQAKLKRDLEGNVTFKMRTDPRVTRVGRWIRRLSIDELPQLWCVVRGDMALVGPRPLPSHEVARFSLRDRRRLDAKPGLTCIWQVSGRSEVPWDEQVEMDLRYIRERSLGLDLKIIAQTIPAVLYGRGAF